MGPFPPMAQYYSLPPSAPSSPPELPTQPRVSPPVTPLAASLKADAEARLVEAVAPMPPSDAAAPPKMAANDLGRLDVWYTFSGPMGAALAALVSMQVALVSKVGSVASMVTLVCQCLFVLAFAFLTASEASLLNLRVSGRRSFIRIWCFTTAVVPFFFIIDDQQHGVEDNRRRAAHLQEIAPFMFFAMFFMGFLHGTLPGKTWELYVSILSCNLFFILRCAILEYQLETGVFVLTALIVCTIPTLSSFYIAQQMVADTNCIGAWRKVFRKLW